MADVALVEGRDEVSRWGKSSSKSKRQRGKTEHGIMRISD